MLWPYETCFWTIHQSNQEREIVVTYKSISLFNVRNPFRKQNGSLRLFSLQLSSNPSTESKLYNAVFLGGASYGWGRTLYFVRNGIDRRTTKRVKWKMGFTKHWQDIPYI